MFFVPLFMSLQILYKIIVCADTEINTTFFVKSTVKNMANMFFGISTYLLTN